MNIQSQEPYFKKVTLPEGSDANFVVQYVRDNFPYLGTSKMGFLGHENDPSIDDYFAFYGPPKPEMGRDGVVCGGRHRYITVRYVSPDAGGDIYAAFVFPGAGPAYKREPEIMFTSNGQSYEAFILEENGWARYSYYGTGPKRTSAAVRRLFGAETPQAQPA